MASINKWQPAFLHERVYSWTWENIVWLIVTYWNAITTFKDLKFLVARIQAVLGCWMLRQKCALKICFAVLFQSVLPVSLCIGLVHLRSVVIGEMKGNCSKQCICKAVDFLHVLKCLTVSETTWRTDSFQTLETSSDCYLIERHFMTKIVCKFFISQFSILPWLSLNSGERGRQFP